MIPKFRGKRKDNGEWVVGVPIPNSFCNVVHMIPILLTDKVAYPLERLHEYLIEIVPETLGQSTGLKDKNGVEIFEGDIVRYTWDMLSDVNATEKGKKVRISKVFWSDWRASWAVGKKSCNNDLFRYARNGNTVEVISNVWENPKLLEQANEN